MKVHWSEKDEKYWIRGLDGEVLWFESSLAAQDAARQIETERDRVDAAYSALRVAAAHVDALAERIRDTAPWYIRRAVESEAKTLESAAAMIRAIDPNQFAGETP